jgi:hypothetical protein
MTVRYLRPPTPPPPGEILIKEEQNIVTPPAPPVVIRQLPPQPETPEPIIIREAPPEPPQPVGRKMITISGIYCSNTLLSEDIAYMKFCN